MNLFAEGVNRRCSQICMRTVDPPNETHAYPWIVPWIQKMGAISTPGSYRGSKKWELKVPLDRTVDPKNGNQKYPWIVPWIRQSVPPSNFKIMKVPLDPYPLTAFKTRKYPWIRTGTLFFEDIRPPERTGTLSHQTG